MHKIISLFLTTIFIFLTQVSYAGNSVSNGCDEFSIQVLNKTDSECLYQSYRMSQGYLVNVTPDVTVLPAKATQLFLVQQNLVQGPTITIDYLCDGHRVSIKSHQNYCLLKAGKISGTVLSSDDAINASYTTTEGSHFWSYPGRIYWALETKKAS